MTTTGEPSAEAPKKSRPYWLLISVACLVPAVLDALKAYLNSRLFGGGNTDWGEVIFSGTEWVFLGCLTPITYFLTRRFPLKRDSSADKDRGSDEKLSVKNSNIIRVVVVHLLGALVLCVSWATLGALLGLVLNRYPAQANLFEGWVSWVLTSLPWSVFMYFTVLGCVYAFDYYREARERETQQALLAAQLAEAQLGALRMQLHPHFLFNSLNAITVLVRDQKTQDASRMLELLSGLLRQVLQGEKSEEVTLDRELQFVDQYLAIEQVRFPDRLAVVWSIDDAVRVALVPQFILQPLVENAIRHGIAKRSEKGTVAVGARAEGDYLVLSVRDDGPGFRPDAQEGVGLRNTRARLETLFGLAGTLEIFPAEGGGTVALIRLPLKRAPMSDEL